MTSLHEKSIMWLVSYINKNSNIDFSYKEVLRTLNKEKEFYVKSYFLTNRYMFGSFCKEAFRISQASNA